MTQTADARADDAGAVKAGELFTAELTPDYAARTTPCSKCMWFYASMTFVMHREGHYVGDLTISMVDPTQSVGRITVKGPSLSPARGDKVTDEETFRRSRG